MTEDSELSIRIYEHGYRIKYIPYAVTYEQEPQEWAVWIRQRMRWVRGNNYVIGKFFRHIPYFKNRRLAFDLLYTLALYYVFFVAIVISDLLFVVSALSLVSIALPGPVHRGLDPGVLPLPRRDAGHAVVRPRGYARAISGCVPDVLHLLPALDVHRDQGVVVGLREEREADVGEDGEV